MYPMSPIVEELGWVAGVLAVIRSYFPFHLMGFSRTHSQCDAIVVGRGNGAIGNVAICGEKEALVNQERIFVDFCYVTKICPIGSIDPHVFTQIFLAPIWHSAFPFCLLSDVYTLSRLVLWKSFTCSSLLI